LAGFSLAFYNTIVTILLFAAVLFGKAAGWGFAQANARTCSLTTEYLEAGVPGVQAVVRSLEQEAAALHGSCSTCKAEQKFKTEQKSSIKTRVVPLFRLEA